MTELCGSAVLQTKAEPDWVDSIGFSASPVLCRYTALWLRAGPHICGVVQVTNTALWALSPFTLMRKMSVISLLRIVSANIV